MAVIPMSLKIGNPLPTNLLEGDRFDLPKIRDEGDVRLSSLLFGLTIVGASIAGLLLYDASRPFASGTLPPAPLVISVDPSPLATP